MDKPIDPNQIPTLITADGQSSVPTLINAVAEAVPAQRQNELITFVMSELAGKPEILTAANTLLGQPQLHPGPHFVVEGMLQRAGQLGLEFSADEVLNLLVPHTHLYPVEHMVAALVLLGGEEVEEERRTLLVAEAAQLLADGINEQWKLLSGPDCFGTVDAASRYLVKVLSYATVAGAANGAQTQVNHRQTVAETPQTLVVPWGKMAVDVIPKP